MDRGFLRFWAFRLFRLCGSLVHLGSGELMHLVSSWLLAYWASWFFQLGAARLPLS